MRQRKTIVTIPRPASEEVVCLLLLVLVFVLGLAVTMLTIHMEDKETSPRYARRK